VRELPGDSELVFVNGAKPIRAQKLQYDREPTFTARLFPAPPIGTGQGSYPGLTPIPSPWSGLSVPQATSARPDQHQLPGQPGWGDGGEQDDLTFDPDDWISQLETMP
jgi:type IV secretion system protein VirD4